MEHFRKSDIMSKVKVFTVFTLDRTADNIRANRARHEQPNEGISKAEGRGTKPAVKREHLRRLPKV